MLPGLIIGSTLLIIVLSFWLARVLGRRMMGQIPAKQEAVEHLMQTGAKARAWVIAVAPGGLVVNSFHFSVEVTFRLDPLHGGTSYEVAKQMLLPITSLPRLGDCWPAWFDAADPTQFAVGVPAAITPEQIAIYREFGIVTPFTERFG